MSICVALNLSDGVVMAVDSATTMFDNSGAITKVFLDADKLFQLGTSKIGIATYGVAALHGRTIGSFIREFTCDPANADLSTLALRDIAERLRRFFLGYYRSFAEKIHAKPFDEIPDNQKGILGLVLGGFSPGSFQSEMWEIVIPSHSAENEAVQRNAPGVYGLNWFASSIPINRYLQGIDPGMGLKIRNLFESILGRPLDKQEVDKFMGVVKEHAYQISYEGLPIQSGIACARFLIDLVIGHYTFVEAHPIVGGKTKIGVVTYGHDAFTIIN